jgi:hypothetical protein
MQTLLYNKDTQKITYHQPQGFYKVNGERPILPDNVVELTITRAIQPVFDGEIEKLERKEVVDLENREYRTEWDIVPLSEQELLARTWKYPEYSKRLDVNENVLFTPMGSAYYAYLQLQGYPIEKDGTTIKVWLDEIAPNHQPFIDYLKNEQLLGEINR